METFSALLALCAGNSPVSGEFPAQRPMTRSFDVFFDLRPDKQLSKQSWGWWFETLSHSLWRHSNVKDLSTFPAPQFMITTRLIWKLRKFAISWASPRQHCIFLCLSKQCTQLNHWEKRSIFHIQFFSTVQHIGARANILEYGDTCSANTVSGIDH